MICVMYLDASQQGKKEVKPSGDKEAGRQPWWEGRKEHAVCISDLSHDYRTVRRREKRRAEMTDGMNKKKIKKAAAAQYITISGIVFFSASLSRNEQMLHVRI